MSIKERQTEVKKLAHLEKFQKSIDDSGINKYLDSFKEKLNFARYFVETHEDGKRWYNTIFQKHDIALILKANAEAAIFTLKSSLDCLANALNKIFNPNTKENTIYFNMNLSKCLKDYESIAERINCFLDENDYFFKLRNLITHNVVVSAKYGLELPAIKIKMSFQPLPDAKNMPGNLEVSSYCYALMDKIYELAEDIFKQLCDEMERYLKPTDAIDSDNPSIKEKAQNLIRGKHEAADKAKGLFYWVRDEIKYNPYVPLEVFENFRASKTLERGQGFYVEKAAVLAAFARAVGIPARLHFADIRNYLVSDKLLKVMGTNLFSYHGYTELYIKGQWVKATPAFDLKMCHKNRIIPVEFDGQNDAILHSHNSDGKLHIEYVKDHGYREDVPVDEILFVWEKHYGLEVHERLAHSIEAETAKGKKGE